MQKPSLSVNRITDIDFAHLASLGIYYFLIDVDNTLAYPKENEALPEFVSHLAQARKMGYIRGICLVSNVIVDSDGKRKQRVEAVGRSIEANGCVCAFWEDRKPKPAAYNAGMKQLGSSASNTAFIGDQLFTDIKGAQNLGLYTVHVKPLGKDNIVTLPNRLREKVRLGLWRFRL